jgi:hypothetical protein
MTESDNPFYIDMPSQEVSGQDPVSAGTDSSAEEVNEAERNRIEAIKNKITRQAISAAAKHRTI